MKIEIKWNVNQECGFKIFDMCDLNINSEKEWDALSETEQQEKLEQALDGCFEQPYMCTESWNKA